MSASPSIDHAAIVAAIGRAEQRTAGEIRVVVARGKVDDPVQAAKNHFERLGMTKTVARNGVLILVAPGSRAFAVIGDTGIHEKCGQDFWRELADAMTAAFREGRLTEGIVLAIDRAGALLADHFPRQSDDQNELPDDVEEV